ncbi:MAG: protease complex subunit PrcB family protein [Candidatus Geothermincolia bacterium]
MATVTAALLLAGALTGCASGPRAIAYEALDTGVSSGHAGDALLLVMADPEDLSQAAELYAGTGLAAQDVSALDKGVLVLALLGERATGGYRIEVASITQEGDVIVVSVAVRSPSPSDVVTQVITSPYALVRVARSEFDPTGQLRFEMRSEAGEQLYAFDTEI